MLDFRSASCYNNYAELNSACKDAVNTNAKKGENSMKKEVLDYVVEQTHALMNAASCSREAKEAAQAWLDAVGTENETEQTKKYVAELEADIVTVDALIGLAESETGAKIFGAEKAKEIAAHGKEIKDAGAVYCDCPACAAVEKILAKKDEMLA